MSIYTDAKKAGVAMESHCSDLHLADTIKAREIIKKNGAVVDGHNIMTFKSNSGETWLDIAFGFDPYWDDRGLPVFTRTEGTEK